MTTPSLKAKAAVAGGWIAFCQAIAAENDRTQPAANSTQKGNSRDANPGR